MADGSSLIKTTKTTCPYCGVGCGVLVRNNDTTTFQIEGDPDHPANHGRLCSKGLALGETLGGKGRLLYPSVKGNRTSWAKAMEIAALHFRKVIAEHGPDAVAFYLSGQILTEDYYVANKLMKGFIGSANIDTNSRLCMASSVAGHKRAFGTDTVPGTYEDLEVADLVILVGSNLAWCHPVLFQRIMAAKERGSGPKIVVIDPRKTASSDFADLHLAIKPGTDIPLFAGLLTWLAMTGKTNQNYVSRHTKGMAETLTEASRWTSTAVAEETGLSKQEIEIFYGLFARTQKTVTVYSQGVNQAADGTAKVNAIINCHLLTGRIGQPGMGPFSVTGQPNAMGGREVGGLANQLTCHMALENISDRERVKRFWRSPSIASKPGYMAVDLFNAIDSGKVKAIWIMATNPVVSMPNADLVKAALKKCDLVVVSDIVENTDTARCADILLPSTGWGEKQGTVTNSERRISRQRRFVTPPGEALDDWKQICMLAKAMGFEDGFTFESPAEIFREYAALTGFENEGDSRRDLDLSGLQDLTEEDYSHLSPVQWPLSRQNHQPQQNKRFFAQGGFYTNDQKARFVPTPFITPASRIPAIPPQKSLVLNSGRIRDQWHTMTRTGLSARLFNHIAEPFVEISPKDAADQGVTEASIAELVSDFGSALARVIITDRQQDGAVFMPMHWTGENSAKSRIGALIAPQTDPVSGQPALKSTRVTIRPFNAAWYGFVAIALPLDSLTPVLEGCDYWAAGPLAVVADPGETLSGQTGAMLPDPVRNHQHTNRQNVPAGVRIELATACFDTGMKNIKTLISLVQKSDKAIETVSFGDRTQGRSATAFFSKNKVIGLCYFAGTPVLASRSFVCDQIGTSLDAPDRASLLAGFPGGDCPDKGAIICSCMTVGRNEILAAIAKGANDITTIGDQTKAGTNCGSCRSEIAVLLKKQAQLISDKL